LKRDPVILIVLAMMASVLLVYGFSSALNGHALSPEELAAVKMRGQAAHDFQLKTTTGNTIHLADLRGRAVVLNFWSTTCEPCKVEMPWLVELQGQYGPQGLQILGMAYDPSDVEDIAGYVTRMGIDYPVLVGTERERTDVANSYGGIPFLPETFYIGRDGRLVEKTIGLKTKDEIENSIRNALAQGQVKVADVKDGPAQNLGGAAPVEKSSPGQRLRRNQ
jgi:peroxiredoxin